MSIKGKRMFLDKTIRNINRHLKDFLISDLRIKNVNNFRCINKENHKNNDIHPSMYLEEDNYSSDSFISCKSCNANYQLISLYLYLCGISKEDKDFNKKYVEAIIDLAIKYKENIFVKIYEGGREYKKEFNPVEYRLYFRGNKHSKEQLNKLLNKQKDYIEEAEEIQVKKVVKKGRRKKKTKILLFNEYHKNLYKPENKCCLNYLKNRRKLTNEMIEKYNIGVNEAHSFSKCYTTPAGEKKFFKEKVRAITFPISDFFCVERVEESDLWKLKDTKYENVRYHNKKGSEVSFFNEHYLEESNKKTIIYLTESVIDSITIEMCNKEYKSIALNGVSNILSFLEKAKYEYNYKGCFILAIDNDAGAYNLKNDIEKRMKKYRFKFYERARYGDDGEYKDINSFYVGNKKECINQLSIYMRMLKKVAGIEKEKKTKIDTRDKI